MFTGYAVVRGAELAAIEAENFGIDHPNVGALWIETIGFPQAGRRHDPQRRRSRSRPAPAPLDLTLRSACALAAAVARKDEAGRRLGGAAAGGAGALRRRRRQPDAAFDKLYEALQETEPKI